MERTFQTRADPHWDHRREVRKTSPAFCSSQDVPRVAGDAAVLVACLPSLCKAPGLFSSTVDTEHGNPCL